MFAHGDVARAHGVCDELVADATHGALHDAALQWREARGCFLSVGFHEVGPFLLLARFAWASRASSAAKSRSHRFPISMISSAV